MKLAITSQGPDLESPMDQRFGRCPYILIVETDDMSYETIENPYAEESGGVGSRLASLVARQGAQAVITEECGPHAQDALRAADIPMIALCADTVRQAVEQYKAGRTSSSSTSPSQQPEHATPLPGGGEFSARGGGGHGRGRGGGGGGGGGRRRRRRERGCWSD